MTGYLFGNDLDSLTCFDAVASSPFLYEAACVAAGADPFERAEQDCRFTQPALVALLLAHWALADDRQPSAILVGEGVGEIAAVAAAGAIASHDAIWLAAVRGRLMSRVAADSELASLALREVPLRTARQVAASHDLRLARDDAPDEVVVTGVRALVEAARRTARKLEIESASLPGQCVFPAAACATVRREWRAALHAAEIQPPRRAVLSCTTVAPVVNARASLFESLTGMIRMRQSRVALRSMGVCRLEAIATASIAG